MLRNLRSLNVKWMKVFFIILFGAGLLACSSVNTITVEGGSVVVTKEYETNGQEVEFASPDVVGG